MSNVITELEKEILPQNDAKFSIGDQVDVHYRIKEGAKERVQIFTGVVIARKGAGGRESFTVRKVVEGEGIEKIMPVHSPFVEKVVVKREAMVRRAKLYYLRGRSAKDTRLKEKVIARKK